MRSKARKSLEGRDGHGRPGPLRRHEVSWGSGEDVSTRSLRGSHGRAFRGFITSLEDSGDRVSALATSFESGYLGYFIAAQKSADLR